MRTLNGAKRNRDPRNTLLLEFQRFVEDFQPRAIMLENVPGLAKYVGFKRFENRMTELGYDGKYSVLDAVDYKTPQRRKCLIYLAGRAKEIPFASPSRRRRTVRNAIGSLPRPGKSGDSAHDLPEKRSNKVLNIIRRIPKDGGSRADLSLRYQLDCHLTCDGFHDVYGRMHWDRPAPTITTGCFNPSKGRFLHPSQNRAITMREAALLQGFPRRYRFPRSIGKCTLALMIGNALPPPLIAAHAASIRSVIQADE